MNDDREGKSSLASTVAFGPRDLPGVTIDCDGQGQSTSWSPPSPASLQDLLPRYGILDLLGYGAMGAVYKAHQESLNRTVAIKILPRDRVCDEVQFQDRFKHEAQSLAQLNHPSIVSIHDFGETPDGLLFIVMEFVEGTDVAKAIKASGRLPPTRALTMIEQVCDALAYAHERGIIHRDIKPSNLLIDSAGRIKVADFGLAKSSDPRAASITRASLMMGTPDFMAPELLIPGCSADACSDVYSVGVMLYQMLTGQIPRGAFSPPSSVTGCDHRLDAVVLKAMKSEREGRYQSAQELGSAIHTLLNPPLATATAADPIAPEMQVKRKNLTVSFGLGRQNGCAGNLAVTFTAAAAVVFGAFVLFRRPEAGISPGSGEPASVVVPASRPPSPVTTLAAPPSAVPPIVTSASPPSSSPRSVNLLPGAANPPAPSPPATNSPVASAGMSSSPRSMNLLPGAANASAPSVPPPAVSSPVARAGTSSSPMAEPSGGGVSAQPAPDTPLPEGMFVLKAGVSLYSATGVRKLAPGAVVRQVGKIGANKVLIEDAGFSGEIEASNLTRDSLEIAAIRKQNREK